nr:hypothetical transcript [Hymenolepis microstoma]
MFYKLSRTTAQQYCFLDDFLLYFFQSHLVSVFLKICRTEFVALHSENVLENLSDYLRDKFEYSEAELESLPEDKREEAKNFNQLLRQFPQRGNFDLNKVLKSTYFFS